ncbi:RNA polymerase sigma factor [Nonomuraea jabiensis]|uniref:RNA polymerase sigma factor n=1 Tax=Nonomuraea jabiensis TaxID=882448 RepID=UPI00160A7743
MTESTIEDTALTRLVRAGDSRAIAELHERHHAAVLALARRLCLDPQTAEDLASEAFVRTLRTVRSGTAGPEGPWRLYLYAVVRDTAAESLRSAAGPDPEFGERRWRLSRSLRAHLESCPNSYTAKRGPRRNASTGYSW